MATSSSTGYWASLGQPELDVPVTYPYLIHTGPSTGQIRYLSGPEIANTGELVRFEMESAYFKVDGVWQLKRLKIKILTAEVPSDNVIPILPDDDYVEEPPNVSDEQVIEHYTRAKADILAYAESLKG
ncbi:hypothetical protein DFJ63DRAFT_337793 [Scheffersomyces coipomensis]|uniref:uncharacterized protein n=1 Tax=Scheffersomyces coipomensis TaxID=1788519 RepID=UPI00315DF40B